MSDTVFHKLLEISVRHSKALIIATIVITLFFGYFAAQITIDPDVASLIPENEKFSLLMEKYGELEEEEDYLVLALELKNPLDVPSLQAVETAVKKIEALPKAKTSITPFNMVTFDKEGKKLAVLPMSAESSAPLTPEEVEAFKRRLLKDPFAKRFLVSCDGSILCIFIPTGTIEDYEKFMEDFKPIVSELESIFNVYYTGSLPFTYMTQQYITSDLSKLIGFAILVILCIYYIGFRTKSSVLLTFMVVAVGTIWTIGFMALLDYPITVISIVTPPLILSLGSSYSIHMLNQYYREVGGMNGNSNGNGLKSATGKGWVTDAAAHINKTIIMASATTVIGFLSLLATTLEKTREFSISASFGIFSCALLSLILLPAVLYNIKPPTEKQRKKILFGILVRSMERLSRFVVRNRITILILLCIIAAGYVFALQHLEHQTDIASYFPKKERIIQDTNYISANVGGFQEVKITLTAPGKEENYFLQPEVMEQISNLEEHLELNKNISNTFSFVSYLEFANETMYGTYELPEKKGLILLLSRYIKVLKSMAVKNEIICSLANEDFSQATITLWVYDSEKLSLITDVPLRNLYNDIQGYISSTLDPEMNPEIWGECLRYLSLSDIIRRDQQVSMLLSLAAIFILTSIAFKSLRYGLFSIIPLTTAIMLNFILMVILDIPLDMTTVMFTSVVIGVGVDNAIHFLLQYKKQMANYPNDINMRLEKTMVIVGRPIILTTASIIGGLMVLTVANFQPVIYFGLLVSITLFAAAVGSLIILPAILSFQAKRDVKKNKRNSFKSTTT